MSKGRLHQLQSWMSSVIMTRGNMRQKVYSAAAQTEIWAKDVVVQSRGMGVIDRLSVYANGYVARLLECLKVDFPLLQKYMTEPVFEKFGQAYLEYQKSESYTLFDLGANFPQFLLDTRPQDIPAEQAAHFDLPYTIALYERAFLTVFRAKGLENEPKNFVHEIPLGFLMDNQMIQAAPCLVCLKLDFPILEIVEQLHKDETITRPDYKTTFLALTRQNFRIIPREIEEWQFHFLEATKTPILSSQAAQISSEKSGKPVADILADLMFFLPIAYENGWLTNFQK